MALEGSVESAIHVFSGDCGTGKTTAVCAVIREWKASGFAVRGSVLIVVGTLAEIDAYVAACAFDQGDYAVVTANQTYNAYGIGRHRATEARVLFTTHEQYRRRVMEAGSFRNAEAFHFLFSARTLTVWDEGMLPAQPATFELNDLRGLPSALGSRSRAEKQPFEALLPDKADCVAGGGVAIPIETAELAGKLAFDAGRKLSEKARRTLESLSKLGGSQAYFCGHDTDGWTMVGRGLPLPSDIAPMFVLDASARLTGNYENWTAYGLKTIRMEPALVSYANLHIRWWDKGCGQTVLATPTDRAVIVHAVADLINSDPDERWLVVHRKDFGKSGDGGATILPDDLAALLAKPENVASVTWGRHIGSNAYRDAGKVIILGSYGYNEGAYQALHLAVSGQGGGVVTKEDQEARKDGEFLHNLYQAVCRSRVRHQVSGMCSEATAYLIMVRNDHREALVRRAFPDCSIDVWQPVAPPKESKLDKIIRVLADEFGHRTAIKKQELVEACGSREPTYLDKIIRSKRFKEYAAKNGIYVKRGIIYKRKVLSNAA